MTRSRKRSILYVVWQIVSWSIVNLFCREKYVTVCRLSCPDKKAAPIIIKVIYSLILSGTNSFCIGLKVSTCIIHVQLTLCLHNCVCSARQLLFWRFSYNFNPLHSAIWRAIILWRHCDRNLFSNVTISALVYHKYWTNSDRCWSNYVYPIATES